MPVKPRIIDFHSHVLPRLDHGSKSSADTDGQLRLIAEMGTDTVIATSHFYPNAHSVELFLQDRERAIERVKELSKASSYGLRLGIGAEVFVYSNMEKMSDLDKLCVRGTRVILLELPFFGAKDDIFETVEAIHKQGYTVVLAHVDRYFHQYENQLNYLFSLGVKAQLNATSLCSPMLRRGIFSHVDPDVLYALGSDLHGHKKSHYAPFVKAERYLGELYGEIMLRTEKLIDGAELLNI